MATPPKPGNEDDGSIIEEEFYDDDDEHDMPDGEASFYSEEGSYRSGEGSFISGEGSHRSGGEAPSYRSGEGSYRSGKGSPRGEEGSKRSGESSYRSGEGSFRSGSGDGSYISGEDSYRSGDGSYRSGEGSHRSGERSYRSGEDERSYRSGDGSRSRSGDGSFLSGEGSYRSGEGSFRSGDGSYRSGEGSFRSGVDDKASLRSGEGSQRSAEGSYRSDEVSYKSGEGSYRSGEGSYRSGEGSYLSGEGSYRSGEGSCRSGEGSYRSGDGSYRSDEGSHKSGDSKSFADDGEHPSFHSEERSYHSGEASYHSSQEGSFHGDNDGPPGPDEDTSLGSRDEESYYSSDDAPSFGEEDEEPSPQSPSQQDSKRSIGTGSEIDSEAPSFAEESDNSPLVKSPRKAIVTPPVVFENGGFADEDFGQTTVTDDEEDNKPVFSDNGFSNDDDEAGAEKGAATFDDFGKDAFGGDAFGATDSGTAFENKVDAFAADGLDGDAFGTTENGGDVFATGAFGENDGADNFGAAVFETNEKEATENGGDAFTTSAFGDNDSADAFASAGFETLGKDVTENGGNAFTTNAFGENDGADAFASATFETKDQQDPDNTGGLPADAAFDDYGGSDASANSGTGSETDDQSHEEGSDQSSTAGIPAGESTSSFAQEAGAATKSEDSKVDFEDSQSTEEEKKEPFGADSFGADAFDGDAFAAKSEVLQSEPRDIPDTEDELAADAFGVTSTSDNSFGGDVFGAMPTDDTGEQDTAFGATGFDAFADDDAKTFDEAAKIDDASGGSSEGSTQEEQQPLSSEQSHHSSSDSHIEAPEQSSFRSFDEPENKGGSNHSEEQPKASSQRVVEGSFNSSIGSSVPPPEPEEVSHESGSFDDEDSLYEKSFHSEDKSQNSYQSGSQSDGRSFHSEKKSHEADEASFKSGNESFHSEGRSVPDEGSFGSGEEGSYRSDEGSFHSESDSQGADEDATLEEGSYRSDEKSFRSEGGSYRSGEGSVHSGEGSFRSEEGSHRSGEGSVQSGERSYRSEEGSYRSGDGSVRSGEGSYRSGEESQRSGSGDESFDSQSSGQSFAEEGSGPLDVGQSFAEEEGSGQLDVGEPDINSAHVGVSDVKKKQDMDEKSSSIVADDDASHKSEKSEDSIGIGDVFGQPNELFEQPSPAQNSKSESQREESTKSEMTQDDTIGDASKVSATDDDYSAKEEKLENGSVESAENSDSLHHTAALSSQPDDQINKIKPKLNPKPKKKEDPEERKRRRKRKKKLQKEAKSRALLDLVANVNDAMLELEEREAEGSEGKEETSAHRLLHGFDALLGIYLQLSDELELISTFEKAKKKKERDAMVSVQALKAVLSFAGTLDELFADLKPIILDCFEEEPDEDMDDMLYRLNSLVDLLCETTHRVGEKQEWNERAETTYVTLLELMEREATELISYYEDVETPEQGLSANIHEAWSATGHIEELRALQYATDPWLFRQLCYEVMVSTDQWCPDTTILMEICGIDPSMLEEEPDSEYLAEEELAPIPQAAEHVLDKVNGEPLPRTMTLASILRRILPPRAVTDATLLDNFTSIRNTIQNPLGLSATNIVSISSVPEQVNDPDSLGVGGIGKSTLAAMVAQHPDVRRYFIDGVVWVYVGDKELNYNRYTQCLRELVAQLDFYQGVPLFAELLHTPGETLSKRRRREEGFMIYARDTIAELLHDRSVLIILDDVCFEPDLDWFDFAPMPGEETEELDSNCALLVTTRCRTLLPAADTVETDMLDEADAISLLIQESGQLSHTLMAESREARSVVRECANHPLAVKSVGRWLNLKHATAGVVSSVEEIHSEVIKSMDKILKGGDHTGTDMMYEILSMSLSPAINGEPTSIIKFCLAAFVIVFCDREYISDFALTEPTPIIPMDMAELLFETLLEMNESSLLQKGSLFYAQKKEAAVLIPEALSALGVLKVITYSDADEDDENPDDEQKFLQVMHFIHHEYGEYLCTEEEALKDLTKDAERQWNRALVEAYLSQVEAWDMDLEDAGHSYALEMIISHMIRGGMYSAAADLLADKSFVRGRLLSLGRENSTRRHIKDCEMLFKKLKERRPKGSKLEPRNVMKQAYQALGSQLAMEDEEQSMEDSRIKDVEVARAHYEIGFSLAEKRCWDAAIAHWETSQEILVSALGQVEVVAGILFNIGVVYSEMNEYEQALDSLKQCLRIRGTIHGEEHILYAHTIQKIGDVFLGMSDYHEAMESYNWALDVMYIEPNLHRVEIGEILDNKGTIHYSKGEIDEALQCHQEALRSKQVDLGEDHPELAATYHHIGNCLSDQGNVDDAIVHFEEAIRLKELDPEGGPERDADVLTIEGILHNLEGNQEQGLECYEKSLQILVTKVPHRKEKVASLLHLIGCVYLMSGEQKKAMKLFEESLQARRKVLGFVHLDVASTLFNMAFLHQTRNRLDKALKCLEEALKIRQLRLPDSEKVAVTHEKIGSLARAIGKTKKAQINFEDALRIRRLLHGEQHEAVATVLQELGDLMDDLGEYDSAMSYYIDALDIRRNRLGLDDIAVAETLYSMGYTLHNNDEPDRALVCFEESLNIRRYQLGEDSKEVGDTLNMMGFLKAKRGDLDDALALLWDALRIRKLQEDHVKVSETLKNIGNVHREKKEQDLAVECYEECLRIRRTELGPDHEKVADALIAMGNVQSDMQRNDDAMRSYQEALKIRTMVFGEHDESVAAVLQYMGTMEFRAGNHEKARDLLTEFIRIRRDNGTKNDGDYVNVLFMIGNIHKMQGHEDDAQLCWSEAYQVFQELGLADNNPQIAKVMNHLLKVEEEKEEAEQKKKAKAGTVFGKMTEKFKGNLKEEKMPGKKKRRKGAIKL